VPAHIKSLPAHIFHIGRKFHTVKEIVNLEPILFGANLDPILFGANLVYD